MSPTPNPSKADRKAAARAAREAKEQEAAAAAARRRRLTQLGALLGVAAALVVVAIAVSSGGGDKKPEGLQGAADVAKTLDGIPQKGLVLGKAAAPVTMIEFVDPQCPYCKTFALDEFPALVEKYVRTGKMKIELRTLSFIGDDSITAARLIQGAAAQDRAWNLSDLLYHNQGQENSGWVTDDLVDEALAAIPGLDAKQVRDAASATAATNALGTANTAAQRYGADSTPSFVLGKTGGEMTKADVEPTASALGGKIDALLSGGDGA